MNASSQGAVVPADAGAAKEEILLLAARGLAEGGNFPVAGDQRFAELAAGLALADPAWSCRLIGWLAAHEALGSAAIVAAVEWVRAGLRVGLPASGGNRQLIRRVLRRPEQPGELLGYWFRRYGHAVPKPIRRGVADAVRVLYDEAAVAVHDRPDTEVRFADVIALAHPRPAPGVQETLFHYLLASRGGPVHDVPVSLPRLHARAALYRLSQDERREILRRADAADVLVQAAMTANMVPEWLGEPLDARAWRAVLPLMDYRDRLHALPAFDEAGLDDRTAGTVAAMLADGARVAHAGVRPLEIAAAGRAVSSHRWRQVLERAADAALEAVPVLPGRTLVLVDRSASLFAHPAGSAATIAADRAAVFGAALALRAHHADLVQVGSEHAAVPFDPADGLTAVTARFREMGDGEAREVLGASFAEHDRVVIVTDDPGRPAWEGGGSGDGALTDVPIYIWNVADRGRAPGQPGRCVFHGLTDGAFEAVSLIESARVSLPF